MALKEQIMKLQTYKMHEGEDTVYVERDDVLKALEQQPCEDEYIKVPKKAKNHVDIERSVICGTQETCEDAWIIDSLKEFLGESYSVLTSNKKEFIAWLERLRWHVTKCNELDAELRNYKKQVECENAISREDALMCMTGEYLADKEYKPEDIISKHIQRLRALPPVTPRSLNPEADREESKAYCAECDHIEMCSWYPHDGCEWLKTDRYNAGYNAAKREIALSGECERAYERGKADAHPDINDGKIEESEK